MTERQEQRVSYLQYLNTFLLSIISIFSVMAWTSLNGVKEKQESIGLELIRMKTVQDNDLVNLRDLSSRTYTLEITSDHEDFKSWVDKNYVRKPQR